MKKNCRFAVGVRRGCGSGPWRRERGPVVRRRHGANCDLPRHALTQPCLRLARACAAILLFCALAAAHVAARGRVGWCANGQVGRREPVRRVCAAAVALLAASLHGAAATCPTFVAWLSSSKVVPTPAAVRANPAAHAAAPAGVRGVRHCVDACPRQEPSRDAERDARRRGALVSP